MRIVFFIGLLFVFSCSERPTTKEKAKGMFRNPSSEEQGKIPDKFQPIDHDIDKAREETGP